MHPHNPPPQPLLVTAALAALPLITHAADTTWLTPVSGSWTQKARWSTNTIPTAADHARIDLPGTYTVSITATQDVGALTLDAPDATLHLTSPLRLSDLTLLRGTLLLDSPYGTIDPLHYTHPLPSLTNHATLTLQASSGSSFQPNYTINAATTNTGTILVPQPPGTPDYGPSLKFAGPSFTNTGSLLTGSRSRIEVVSPAFDQNAGTIAGNLHYTGPTFNFNAGTASTVHLRSATLNVSPAAGQGAFVFRGPSNTLAGANLAPGSYINLTDYHGGAGETSLILPDTYANHGRIFLGHDSAAEPLNSFVVRNFAPTLRLGPDGTGTLTNLGSLELNSPHNYPATLHGRITNHGSITINRPYSTPGFTTTLAGSWINHGTIALSKPASTSDIVPYPVRFAPGASFTQNAGTLSIDGAEIEIHHASFNFNGGTTTGGWIALYASSLNLTPNSGSGNFFLASDGGIPSSLTGDIPAPATIRLSTTSSSPRHIITPSLTNAGTLFSVGSSSELRIDNGAGTLTNTGTLDGSTVVNSQGAAFRITGSLHNTGTIRSSALRVSGGTLTHDAGSIHVTGSLQVSSGAFVHNAGTLTGNPVTLSNASLHIAPGAPPASFRFDASTGTLTGHIPAGGSVSLAPFSTSSPHLTVTAPAASFSNDGTLTLHPRSTLLLTYADTPPLDFVRHQLLTHHITPADPTLAVAYTNTGPALHLTLTLPGDANLDGLLNADDYALLDRGFANQGQFWWDGDFNYDGQVDQNDYLLLDRTYLLTKAQGWQSLGSSFFAQRTAQFGPTYVSQLLTSIPEPSPFSSLLSTLYFLLSSPLPRRSRPAR